MTKLTVSKPWRKPVCRQRAGLNPTRTITPCYRNTTLGNRLYTQHKGPNVTNPIFCTCKNCSYKCAADCERCVTIQHRAVLITFPLKNQQDKHKLSPAYLSKAAIRGGYCKVMLQLSLATRWRQTWYSDTWRHNDNHAYHNSSAYHQRFKVVQGQRSCCQSIANGLFPLLTPASYLSLFFRYLMCNSNDFKLGLFKVIQGQRSWC